MGKRQEPGFSTIRHEVTEALARLHLTSSAHQVTWHIIRLTNGYQRESTKISLLQFQKATGLSKRTLVTAVQMLQAKGIVRADKNPGKHNTYRLQPPDEWQLVKQTAPVTSEADGASQGRSTPTSTPRTPVKQAAPDQCRLLHQHQCSALHQTSEVAGFGATMPRDNSRDNLIDNLRDTCTPTPAGPSINDGPTTPPLAGNGEERVLQYLRSHGPCRLGQLSGESGIRYLTLQVYLTKLKKAGLVNNPQRGKWEAVNA